MWKMLGAAALLGLGAIGRASTPYTATAECPIGGKSFTYTGYASYSTWGSLPDGQPVGSARFPLTIPQCPETGLCCSRSSMPLRFGN